jgi:hypothetical protein
MAGVMRSSMLTRGLWLEGTSYGLSSGSQQYGTGSQFVVNVSTGVRSLVFKYEKCQEPVRWFK